MRPIYVAIDTPDLERARDIATRVRHHVGGIKLGLEFFSANGRSGIREMAEWMKDRTPRVTTRVDVSDHLDARDAALRAHASQVAPDTPFFFWPHDVVRRAWPTEDFELVRSTVADQGDETDLFAGIDEE